MLAEKLLFRFAIINDLHLVSAPGIERYERSNEKAQAVIRCLNFLSDLAQIEFVVGLGDIIHGGRLAALRPDLLYAKELISALKYDYFPVVGNHEIVQAEGDRHHELAYREIFGHDRVSYTFMRAGVQFIAINNGGAPDAPDAVAAARARWLSEHLRQAEQAPVILFCHVPLVPLREPEVLDQSFVIASSWDRDGRCLEVLERRSDKVVAVFSGHLHLSGKIVKQGITHCCVSGTASYPCDYAICSVWPDQLEVELRQLPPTLITPSTNIHGRSRHGRDFTDTDHRDADSYVTGNLDERHFVVSLKW